MMFIILLNYKVPIALIDEHIVAHRNFLQEGYERNYFIVSGPKNPRDGGVIISQLTNRGTLEDVLKNDPFKIFDLADYEIIEFTPVKHHRQFTYFIE